MKKSKRTGTARKALKGKEHLFLAYLDLLNEKPTAKNWYNLLCKYFPFGSYEELSTKTSVLVGSFRVHATFTESVIVEDSPARYKEEIFRRIPKFKDFKELHQQLKRSLELLINNWQDKQAESERYALWERSPDRERGPTWDKFPIADALHTIGTQLEYCRGSSFWQAHTRGGFHDITLTQTFEGLNYFLWYLIADFIQDPNWPDIVGQCPYCGKFFKKRRKDQKFESEKHRLRYNAREAYLRKRKSG